MKILNVSNQMNKFCLLHKLFTVSKRQQIFTVILNIDSAAYCPPFRNYRDK